MDVKIRITSNDNDKLGEFVYRLSAAGFKFENTDVHKRRDGASSFYSDVDLPDPIDSDLDEEGYCDFCGCHETQDTEAYVALDSRPMRESVSLKVHEHFPQELEIEITPDFDNDVMDVLEEHFPERRIERITQCSVAGWSMNFCPKCGRDLRQADRQLTEL